MYVINGSIVENHNLYHYWAPTGWIRVGKYNIELKVDSDLWNSEFNE
jgi:hypothetical protein